MPVPKKPSHRRQRTQTRDLVIVRQEHAEIPDPPPNLPVELETEWTHLWQSSLAGGWSVETDVPALRRLFKLRAEVDLLQAEFEQERFVEGQKGQPRINPLANVIAADNAEIRQLEDRFGLTPKARASLGVELGAAHRSLREVNSHLAQKAHRGSTRNQAQTGTKAIRPSS